MNPTKINIITPTIQFQKVAINKLQIKSNKQTNVPGYLLKRKISSTQHSHTGQLNLKRGN